MAKKKKAESRASSPSTGRTVYASRKKVAYAGIPRSYFRELERMGEEDGQFKKRSVAFLTQEAVEDFFRKHGRQIPDPDAEPEPRA